MNLMRQPEPRLLTTALGLTACAAVAHAGEAQPAAATPEPSVHAVTYSHEDVGYADEPHVLRTENRMENISRALRLCDKTAAWPEAARFRYDQEASEPLPLFLSNCTMEMREKLAEYMREGRISVAATHTTVLADRLNPEAAARLFYLSGRHLPDMLGVPQAKVAMIDDVTGIPWSLPIYCQAAQVPWIFHGHNVAGRCDALESAPLVRWTGPRGTGEVFVHSACYGALHGMVPADELKKVMGKTADGRLPVILDGWDFSLPDMRMADAALAWNARGGKQVRLSTFDQYFTALSRHPAGANPPSVSKTGPCQWMDQPVADALSFGRARLASERLPAAEKWGAFALAGAPSGGYAPAWFEIANGWHTLLSNYEHTAGAACWRCKDMEGFRHYETEQVEHREESQAAADSADRAQEAGLAALTAQIASQHDSALAVFNPLGRARTEVVKVAAAQLAPALRGKALAAVDDASGASLPCQWLDGQTLAFTAADVPALGYRSYHFAAAQPAPAAPASAAGGENAFYKITLDPATGCIASLFDKELGRELVKKNAPQAFGQYLLHRIEAKKARDWIVGGPPHDAKITVEHGPVADLWRVRSQADGVAWLEETFTLWHGVKRLDIELKMDKRPSGRSLIDYFANNLRGKEAVFACMPFDIPDFKATYQSAGGGVAEPIRDQFLGTGTAFQAVQHFADLSNRDFGVTVSPIDCALVEFGAPRADAVSRMLPGSESTFEKKRDYPADSTLHLYLLDNMFATNIRIDQRGAQAFHWALCSHAGDVRAGRAASFGEGVNQPLIARALPAAPRAGLPAGAHSFAAVDASNVSVAAFKPAEWNGDGYIVRLVETEGRAATAILRAPVLGALAGVRETSLTETDLGRTLAIAADGGVAVDLPPFGVKTLRLLPAAPAPAQVQAAAAAPLSDMEVEVTWAPVPGAAFYRVYRGERADFTPTPFHLVALTAAPRLVDLAQNHGSSWIANRLRPETAYFYRIEAVSRQNRRGPLSAAAPATTLATAQKACAPGAVADLHAILVSPLAPVNAVNLLWRSNVEPNVAAYEIHRSSQAGFTPSPQTLLAKVKVAESAKATDIKVFDHQMYFDKAVAKGATYHYSVRAITAAGQPGAFSAEAQVTTKLADDEMQELIPPG